MEFGENLRMGAATHAAFSVTGNHSLIAEANGQHQKRVSGTAFETARRALQPTNRVADWSRPRYFFFAASVIFSPIITSL